MLDIEQRGGEQSFKPKSFRELLANFCDENDFRGELLRFGLGENYTSQTVYNPAPVVIDDQKYLWARVESRSSERDSVIRLFKESNDEIWDIVEGAPVFKNLQDPFYCGLIDGCHIFGGVQIYEVEGTTDLGYRTALYSYKESFEELMVRTGEVCEPFLIGPEKMKGIRLIQISDDRIGVFTRPQDSCGEFGGRGKIGYFEISSLDQLKNALERHCLEKNTDTLIKGLFVEENQETEEWGGANALYLLSEGKIGVLGHIACFGDKKYIDTNGNYEARKKDYHPISFIFDPLTKSVSDVQIIATTKQFPSVEAKKNDLGDVLYSGGLVFLNGEKAWLYLGIGDCQSGRVLINNPFKNYFQDYKKQ